MAKQLDTQALDALFLHILKGLLQAIIQKSDDAAEKILALSSELVDKDVQSALVAFHRLYTDENIDQVQSDFNRHIDEIIETRGEHSSDALNEHAGVSLAHLQQQLEKAINVDQEMKAKTAPVLYAIQFSELIHRHVANIEKAWRFAMQELAKGEECQSIAINIDSLLTTQFERKAFNQKVLKMDVLLETEEEVDHLLDAIL